MENWLSLWISKRQWYSRSGDQQFYYVSSSFTSLKFNIYANFSLVTIHLKPKFNYVVTLFSGFWKKKKLNENWEEKRKSIVFVCCGTTSLKYDSFFSCFVPALLLRSHIWLIFTHISNHITFAIDVEEIWLSSFSHCSFSLY